MPRIDQRRWTIKSAPKLGGLDSAVYWFCRLHYVPPTTIVCVLYRQYKSAQQQRPTHIKATLLLVYSRCAATVNVLMKMSW